MKLLVLGGTGWLGSTVAAAAVRESHEVTCLARGEHVPAGVALVHADRDRDDALTPLGREDWDAVIDLARQPGHVRRAARDLADAAARYVFVSSGNVYASQAEIGADEDAALLVALEADSYTDAESSYGPGKVAGEIAVRERFGDDRYAIARAGLIGGPGDPTGRTTYWPRRFARPSNERGDVLAPAAPDLPTAIVDVRDLADWLLSLARGTAPGVFNAVGDAIALPRHLALAREVASSRGSLVEAESDWLLAHGVAEWVGPRSLPLWLADREWQGMNARSNDRAVAAGLRLRPLAETLADALAAGHVEGAAGLSDEDERALLAQRAS